MVMMIEEKVQTSPNYLDEAFLIIEGRTWIQPTREHLIALRDYIAKELQGVYQIGLNLEKLLDNLRNSN